MHTRCFDISDFQWIKEKLCSLPKYDLLLCKSERSEWDHWKVALPPWLLFHAVLLLPLLILVLPLSLLCLMLLFSHQVVSDSLWPCGLQHARLLSPTISWSLPKFVSIESVTPSNHLILCCPLLLLLSMFHSIKVFPNESAVRIRWPKYWSFSLAYRKLEPTENPFWKNIRRKQTNKNAS